MTYLDQIQAEWHAELDACGHENKRMIPPRPDHRAGSTPALGASRNCGRKEERNDNQG